MRGRLVLFALSALCACGDDAGLPDARPPIDAPPAGHLAVAWMLNHGGAPQTCASVGATSVSLEIVVAGQPFGVTDAFGCSNGMGVSRDLAPDRYDFKVSVTGAGVLDGPDDFPNVEIRPNETTMIGPVMFDVDPTGTLAFRVNTTATGGNCAPTASMGAGITATTIVLRDAANACVPTTFAIAAGATRPAGTYTSDCAGASYGCIDADQDITATGVIAGQHSMILTGAIGAAPCWKRTSQFTTRAAMQTTTLNPQTLTLDTMVAGCPAM
jgi:hypothetical protein